MRKIYEGNCLAIDAVIRLDHEVRYHENRLLAHAHMYLQAFKPSTTNNSITLAMTDNISAPTEPSGVVLVSVDRSIVPEPCVKLLDTVLI